MLILPIKKKWFDMVLEPNEHLRKLDEYRERNEYWGKRFATALGFKDKHELDKYIMDNGHSEPFDVMYRNGYSANSPSFIAKVSLSIGTGKEEWGAELGKEYYVLSILEVME